MEVSPAVQKRISTAVAQFKTQMRASNKHYINNLVFVANTLPVSERMGNFAQSIHFGGSFPSSYKTPEEVLANPPPGARSSIENDGTWPVKSEAEQRQYLRGLTEKINENFDEDDENGKSVSVPEEYRALLKESDGVWDIDFRRSGVVGINGTNCLGGGGIPFVGRNEPFQQIDTADERGCSWDVATGWCLDGNETASHYYFYCQRTSEGRGGPVQANEREWEWRLFYRDLDSSEDVSFRVFHSIPEFLRWFADWYARDVEGDEDGDMAPGSVVRDPPYEEGVNYDDDEDDEDSDEEEDDDEEEDTDED
ncbi:hypothetical protein VTL71DRAFT_3628 [Oculimacula yallundae]|uniref:Knr4/Smi1-like domain-containing protein n=1 Tax=Oculimacula yallundae TaxID=86028 RepID=A0ABR4C7P3_9HELO